MVSLRVKSDTKVCFEVHLMACAIRPADLQSVILCAQKACMFFHGASVLVS